MPSVFVNVGANVGFYTVMMALKVGHKGVVIAIEPERNNFEALRVNIERNKCDNVTALNIAAYSQDKTVTLWASPDSWGTGMFTVGDSIYYKNVHGTTVEAKRLDGVLRTLKIDSVDCVKVDVEGTEAEVLKGLDGYLDRCNSVIFEAWDDPHLKECKKVIESHGNFLVKPLDKENFVAVRLSSGAERGGTS